MVEAESAYKAMLLVHQKEPDLVLSNLSMAGMEGLELFRDLREAGYDGSFGFITTESEPEQREMAEEAGVDFLLAKPFGPEQLLRTLENHLGCRISV